MTSIKELKSTIIKEPHPELWMHTYLNKKSLYITRLLLKTNITPNQITLYGILIGIIGVFLISFSNSYISIAGYFVVFIYYITDFCDGQVARYKNMGSLKGKYWDYIGHIVIYPIIFFSIGVHLYNQSGNIFGLFIGIFTTLFYLALFINQKLYILVAGSKKSQIQEHWEKKGKKTIKAIAIRIHKTIQFQFYVITYFILAEVGDYFLGKKGIEINLVFYLLTIYLIVYSLTFLAQIVIFTKRIEKKENLDKINQNH